MSKPQRGTAAVTVRTSPVTVTTGAVGVWALMGFPMSSPTCHGCFFSVCPLLFCFLACAQTSFTDSVFQPDVTDMVHCYSSWLVGCLTLHVLYHTIPHELCRCQVKDVHSLQSFTSTWFEESDSVLFILWLQWQILLTSTFSKENSAISLEEWVLVFEVFTSATGKLRVKVPATCWCIWGWICSEKCTCCHTRIEVADQTCYHTQSQYTDTVSNGTSTDPIMPGG